MRPQKLANNTHTGCTPMHPDFAWSPTIFVARLQNGQERLFRNLPILFLILSPLLLVQSQQKAYACERWFATCMYALWGAATAFQRPRPFFDLRAQPCGLSGTYTRRGPSSGSGIRAWNSGLTTTYTHFAFPGLWFGWCRVSVPSSKTVWFLLDFLARNLHSKCMSTIPMVMLKIKPESWHRVSLNPFNRI